MAPPVPSAQKLAVAVVLALATSMQGLLTYASKVDGVYPYNTLTVPLLSEFFKVLYSGGRLFQLRSLSPAKARISLNWRSTLLYVVPSLIYLVQNNVTFYTLKYVDAPTYQILGNLKIVTTGLFMRILLGRRLTQLQYTALALLVVGATMSQIVSGCLEIDATSASGGGGGVGAGGSAGAGGKGLGNGAGGRGDRVFSSPWEGYALGVLSAWLSGAAGVYTELLLKRSLEDSIYWQNVQLYSFGVLFNAAALLAADARGGFPSGVTLLRPSALLRGYSPTAWLVVLNLAFSGLLVSWLMKWADNILKVFSTSMSMLVTMAASAMLFGTALRLPLLLGIFTACASVQLYYTPPAALLAEAQACAAADAAAAAALARAGSGVFGAGGMLLGTGIMGSPGGGKKHDDEEAPDFPHLVVGRER